MDSRLQFEWYDIEDDPVGWDEHVAGRAQNLFHRSAMLAAQQFGRAFRRGVVVKRWGGAVGLLGGLVSPMVSGGQFQAFSFPPRSAELDAGLPMALSEWLVAQGVTRIELGSFDGGIEGYEHDHRAGRLRERYEFLYDLRRPEEERLQQAGEHHRRKLRKSLREPMRLERIERAQPWVMTRLNTAWSRRHGHALRLSRLWHDFRYYRRLTQRLSQDGSASLYGIYAGRRPLSMAYMLERGGTAFYMIGASSEEGYRRGAAVRLFWELARQYPERGIDILNFGGVPVAASDERHPEHGMYRFKLGFGIEPTLRRSLSIEA